MEPMESHGNKAHYGSDKVMEIMGNHGINRTIMEIMEQSWKW
jgi:hypothetical protein